MNYNFTNNKKQPTSAIRMPFEYTRTAEGHYQCPHCHYSKANQSTVHMHIKAKHMGTFKHKCTSCEYETSTKQNLDNHIAAKHPEQLDVPVKEVSCPGCSFACRNKAQLRSHYLLKHLAKYTDLLMKKMTTGEIECTCCNNNFKSKAAFVYHCVKCLPSDVKEHAEHKEGLGL